jgi:16S rRNA (guanine527-N7)-methyltransferase
MRAVFCVYEMHLLLLHAGHGLVGCSKRKGLLHFSRVSLMYSVFWKSLRRVFHVEHMVGDEEKYSRLVEGAGRLGIELEGAVIDKMDKFIDLLLEWNRKVNLTSIRDKEQAIEGHLIDSLAVLPVIDGASSVIDLGAGGGLPSLPLAIVLRDTSFYLVESLQKKVGFLKAAIATLKIPNAQVFRARAQGNPEAEGLPRCAMAISRAFLPLEEWVNLGRNYVVPKGQVVAMLGPEGEAPIELPASIRRDLRSYQLPYSQAKRRIAVYSVD